MHTHYYDDPDEGLARETSHPRFRELATEEFYYDCTDDFSPFGNDDGAEVLYNLEDFYRDGARDEQVPDFLRDLIEEWDFGVPPDLMRAELAELEAQLADDDMLDSYLGSVCNAYVATAFGQLKITGKVLPELRTDGLAAIDCMVMLNKIARRDNPAWKHADKNLERLVEMRKVLESA